MIQESMSMNLYYAVSDWGFENRIQARNSEHTLYNGTRYITKVIDERNYFEERLWTEYMSDKAIFLITSILPFR